MAGRNQYQIFTQVNFKLQGVDEGVMRAKKRIGELDAEIKRIETEYKNRTQDLRARGESVREDAIALSLKKNLANAKDEQKKLNELVKDGVRQYNVMKAAIDGIDEMTARTANQLRRDIPKILSNINSLSAGAQEKIRQLAEDLRISEATVRKFAAGFSDMTKPFDKMRGETYGNIDEFAYSMRIDTSLISTQNAELTSALRDFTAMMADIRTNGIPAYADMYGKHGMQKQMERANKLVRENGL